LPLPKIPSRNEHEPSKDSGAAQNDTTGRRAALRAGSGFRGGFDEGNVAEGLLLFGPEVAALDHLEDSEEEDDDFGAGLAGVEQGAEVEAAAAPLHSSRDFVDLLGDADGLDMEHGLFGFGRLRGQCLFDGGQQVSTVTPSSPGAGDVLDGRSAGEGAAALLFELAEEVDGLLEALVLFQEFGQLAGGLVQLLVEVRLGLGGDEEGAGLDVDEAGADVEELGKGFGIELI
jgi:hypothetical protein